MDLDDFQTRADEAALAALQGLSRRRPLVMALTISVMAHLVAIMTLALPEVKAAAEPTRLVELFKLPPPAKARLKGLPPPPEPPKPPPPPPPPVEKRPSGQVVDLGPKPPDDQTPPPERSRYLSERNLRTERETVKPSRARTGSPGNKPPKEKSSPTTEAKKEPKPKEPKPREKEKPKEPVETAKLDTKPPLPKPPAPAPAPKPPAPAPLPKDGPLPSEETAPPAKPAKPDLLKEDPHRRMVPVDVARRDPVPDEKKDPSPGKDQLKVTISDLNKTLDADDGSIDHLPGVPRGDITVLNSKQFTYASFFNRMKKVIRFHWDPEPALRAIGDPALSVSAGFWIVLNRDGSVESIETVEPSGYPLWDAAAIKAVRKAAPFYNVPEGLLDENGRFGSKWNFITY